MCVCMCVHAFRLLISYIFILLLADTLCILSFTENVSALISLDSKGKLVNL